MHVPHIYSKILAKVDFNMYFFLHMETVIQHRIHSCIQECSNYFKSTALHNEYILTKQYKNNLA